MQVTFDQNQSRREVDLLQVVRKLANPDSWLIVAELDDPNPDLRHMESSLIMSFEVFDRD